jgi:hypothetical protein
VRAKPSGLKTTKRVSFGVAKSCVRAVDACPRVSPTAVSSVCAHVFLFATMPASPAPPSDQVCSKYLW